DIAQMQVQNRVSNAEPRLPEEVRRLGVITRKQSPDLLLAIHLISPDRSLDSLHLGNYAVLNILDTLKRIDGVGDARVFGADEYAMRVWLDPDRLVARGLTASDVVNAIREQNVQVAAGAVGQQPGTTSAFQLTVTSQGRLRSVDDFRQIVVKAGGDGQIVRLGVVARLELGAATYALRALLDGSRRHTHLPASRRQRAGHRGRGQADHGPPQGPFPSRHGLPHRVRHHGVRAAVHRRGDRDLLRSPGPGRRGGDALPPDLARGHYPAGGGAGVHRRHLCPAQRPRLLDQHPDPAWPGARDRHRGGRRDRGGRERRAPHQ
ncbi:MAG: efflux RND transporter permease subunit, partial [Halothiobacillaceae bacterium]